MTLLPLALRVCISAQASNISHDLVRLAHHGGAQKIPTLTLADSTKIPDHDVYGGTIEGDVPTSDKPSESNRGFFGFSRIHIEKELALAVPYVLSADTSIDRATTLVI
jgi:hypothetical protein